MLILITFAGLRPIGSDFDSLNYVEYIFNRELLVEPTFTIISEFYKNIFSDREYIIRSVFLTYAILNVLIVCRAINKFSNYSLLSILLYFFISYPMLTFTQIRYGVAIAIFMWALHDLVIVNRKKFLIKIIAASTFHYSLLLALPLIFISSARINKRFYFLLPIVCLGSTAFSSFFLELAISFFSMFSGYIEMKMRVYLNPNLKDTMPVFNSLSAIVICVYYLTLFNFDKISSRKVTVLIKTLGWLLSIYFAMDFIEIFSKRSLFLMSSVIVLLLPFTITLFKQRIIIVFFILIYCTMYYFNMTVRHGLIDYELYRYSLNYLI